MTDLAVGEVFAGHRVDGVIGRGGMGTVYLATQLALDRQVALKLIAGEHAADDGFRRRLLRESRLASRIEHPRVVSILDAGEHAGRPYVTMRFVEGVDLAELIAAHGRLPPMRAARLVAQVASGLAAAHERGLVHRDVKPGNVLVSGEGGAYHAYLTDFGLVRSVDDDGGLTVPGAVVGSLDYLAPEQAEGGGAVDHRADLYGLGCVLYETLTGQVPYPREALADKLIAHKQAPVPSARLTALDVPPALDAVARRAMAKDPAERFQAAADMERALVAAIEVPREQVAAPARARRLSAEEVIAAFEARTGHPLRPVARGDGWSALEPPLRFDARGLAPDSLALLDAFGSFTLYVPEDAAAFDAVVEAAGFPAEADPDGHRWKREQDDPRAPESWVTLVQSGALGVAWRSATRGAIDDSWVRLHDLVEALQA